MRLRRGPAALWLVRHGESVGNVRREAAYRESLHEIGLETRDADSALTPRGEEQARAFGRWLAAQPEHLRPTAVLSSPYVRARETARLALEAAGEPWSGLEVDVDERLRDRELGLLDGLTWRGIVAKYPEEAERKRRLGKFYHRPPGGESWCDVILRLRSMLDTITREYRRERLLIVGHQVIVNCYRYLLERLDEAAILDIDRAADVPNCSVTSYEFDPAAGRSGKLVPKLVNFIAPLEEAGAPITAEPDVPAAPKS